ncbi:hypothetical protein [Caldimonas sp. KR1-144]|uniref:hypothetical protein n=1 Tax=Caldimonas sp. KR1-144 TaxID=3400911 RepID=UPI003C0AD884
MHVTSLDRRGMPLHHHRAAAALRPRSVLPTLSWTTRLALAWQRMRLMFGGAAVR